MNKRTREIESELISMMRNLAVDWSSAPDIRPETLLFTELELESLDAVILSTAIQEKYNQVMPFAELFAEIGREQRDLSVSEMADFVDRHLPRL